MKKYIIILISLAIILYVISLTIRINRISKFHDPKLDYFRKEVGLELFDKDWLIDTIEFLGYGNYSIYELEKIPKWKLLIENERSFYEEWKVNENQVKKICYFKSIWLWKNKFILEGDCYEFPVDTFHNIEICTFFDYLENDWYCRVDTTESKYYKAYLDSLDNAANLETGFQEPDYSSLFDTIGISIEKARDIISEWKDKTKNTNL